MIHTELLQFVEHEDCDSLSERYEDIVSCVECEMQSRDKNPESYLLHWIARCPNHTVGRIMFQIFRRACGHSQYHWYEIMRDIGYPMMVGAVMSENIKLLEHAMIHVDEIELERILNDVDIPKVQQWYDENFLVT
jgi:hypothetical protein